MADKESVAPFNRTPFTKGVQRGYNWNGVYRYVFRNNSTWWGFIIIGAAFGELITDKVTNGVWSAFNPGKSFEAARKKRQDGGVAEWK